MGYKTKVQLIKRKTNEQWYVNFPMVLAQALEFGKGEEVEWVVAEDGTLLLTRPNAPERTTVKKTGEAKV
jgi:antitoxin component of MazEF toxin-antitoxin module